MMNRTMRCPPRTRKVGMIVHRSDGWELYERLRSPTAVAFIWVYIDRGTEEEVRKSAAEMGLVEDLAGPLRHGTIRDRLHAPADVVGAFGLEDRRMS